MKINPKIKDIYNNMTIRSMIFQYKYLKDLQLNHKDEFTRDEMKQVILQRHYLKALIHSYGLNVL